MRQILVVIMLAVLLAGCGADSSEETTGADARKGAQIARGRALSRLTDDMSAEYIEGLVAKMEKDYPHTGYDMWVLADDILSYDDNPSNTEFERRLKHAVLQALRTKAENIFAAVYLGSNPPGTDKLQFVITNRTDRQVSKVVGVMQIRNTVDGNVESMNFKVDKPVDPGRQVVCDTFWTLPTGLHEQLVADDNQYELKFVARKVTYIDGTIEVYP